MVHTPLISLRLIPAASGHCRAPLDPAGLRPFQSRAREGAGLTNSRLLEVGGGPRQQYQLAVQVLASQS